MQDSETERVDIQARIRGDLTAIQWLDKRDICTMTNIHNPPQEGNFRNEQVNMIKLEIVADYNHHMGYVNKGDRMANSYSSAIGHGSGQKSCFSICFIW